MPDCEIERQRVVGLYQILPERGIEAELEDDEIESIQDFYTGLPLSNHLKDLARQARELAGEFGELVVGYDLAMLIRDSDGFFSYLLELPKNRLLEDAAAAHRKLCQQLTGFSKISFPDSSHASSLKSYRDQVVSWLRNPQIANWEGIGFGLQVDPFSRTVSRTGFDVLQLSEKKFRLISLLSRYDSESNACSNRAITHDFSTHFSDEEPPADDQIKHQISALRPSAQSLGLEIRNKRSIGYYLVSKEAG